MGQLGDYNISAVIVAAGRGQRMNTPLRKQFINLEGMPVLARTIEVFQSCEYIDNIVLAINIEDINYCKYDIVNTYGFTKVRAVVEGGETRTDSVYNCLKALKRDTDYVVIHDGVRPLVTDKIILDTLVCAVEYGCAVTGMPVKDTIKVVDGDNVISNTPDRQKLWAVHTPQIFRYDIITDCYNKAYSSKIIGTDDAFLAETFGYPVKMVEGSYDNIKITTEEDIAYCESVIRTREGGRLARRNRI
ncbi:MAG: 2-C-methyl-D-erythritol 4-phosphate cytidylyltransferase [Clostridia bacterium]|nr:2-C-methyl-D-erythritol 4-phosphate cytidylyltransferase [Clostridia bacterium]